MIYTVTFNPALDYIVSVPDFQMGRTNRSVAEQIFPGVVYFSNRRNHDKRCCRKKF